MTGCWSIWKVRNDLLFLNKRIKIDNIFSQVKALDFLWYSSRSKHKDISWVDWCKFVIT
ncbi:hypothetical protein HanXRQr2_Chr01g0028141 [Helianthus annuus]|uniref:Uncharacterized protein n=1 Tax=Helianthus annuus TaxID=4232 RepID=A0A9K3JW52_HELAN|nr:hypothetical protein HanXRQr2_Chr01g0028141 [Helianthus annuus]KAJ0957418.1 hypothetical protein HanPSC8_Chr01g0027071 [Helianthus annuus]